MFLSYRPPAAAELRSAGRTNASVPTRTSKSARFYTPRSRFAVALGSLAPFVFFSCLCAFPDPKPTTPAPHIVRMVEQWIPMSDGVRLSATLYMPDNAKAGEKFPALLEYLPYRKDDATAARDYPVHAWFAARGYVSVRVDIRGFGASEGTPTDREYSEQEQLDGEQVIAWLANSTLVDG